MNPKSKKRKLSQKKEELIKIVEESTPGEINIYYKLVNALNKKRVEKHGWISK